MKKWEYQLLVQLWDHEKGGFYWADNERDPRCPQECLDALRRKGWEAVLPFPCGTRVPQHNYLLKRPVVDRAHGTELE
jgi:hypothetical protein